MNYLIKAIFCSLVLVSVCSAEHGNIKISQVQLYNLGIKLGNLQPVNQVPLLYAPAKVSVPPSEEFLISASQAGLVSQLNVAIGDSVQQGQILASLKSPELLALQREYLKTNSDRRLAKAGVERDKKLLEEGVISDRRWQETRASYFGLVAKANEARQLLEIAGMSKVDIKKLANTHKLSSQLNIRSPISGVVLDRLVYAGERIDMLAPLYRIANLEKLWLEISIPQEQIEHLAVGNKVIIDKSSVTAKISLLGQNVNPENQTILARAVIDGETPNVRVGQTVTTQIIRSSDRPVFKIPDAGIAQFEGEHYVFIRYPNGFIIKQVDVVGKESASTIISSDFTGHEQVAIRGAVTLKANWLNLGSDEDSGAGSHGGH